MPKRLSLLLYLFLLSLSACTDDEAERPSSESAGSPITLTPNEVEQEIITAARAYLEEVSDVDSTDLAIEAIQGDYARIAAIPPPHQADPAVIFLKKSESGWKGIALGTMFTPQKLDALGIPNALRDLEDDFPE